MANSKLLKAQNLRNAKAPQASQVISTPQSPIKFDAPFVNPGYRQPLLSKKAKRFLAEGAPVKGQQTSNVSAQPGPKAQGAPTKKIGLKQG